MKQFIFIGAESVTCLTPRFRIFFCYFFLKIPSSLFFPTYQSKKKWKFCFSLAQRFFLKIIWLRKSSVSKHRNSRSQINSFFLKIPKQTKFRTLNFSRKSRFLYSHEHLCRKEKRHLTFVLTSNYFFEFFSACRAFFVLFEDIPARMWYTSCNLGF